MPVETFAKRFLKTMKDNGFNQKLIEKYTGISQASISDINTGKVVKKYENIDTMFDLLKTDDQKFYVATGKHLPEPSNKTEDYQSKMLEQMVQMNQMMSVMVNKIDQLSHKIEMLENIGSHTESHREVNEGQGQKNRVAQKIPDQ